MFLFIIISRANPQFSDPVKKQDFKVKQKKHAEVSQMYIKNLLLNIVEINERAEEIEAMAEGCIGQVITDTVAEDYEDVIV